MGAVLQDALTPKIRIASKLVYVETENATLGLRIVAAVLRIAV